MLKSYVFVYKTDDVGSGTTQHELGTVGSGAADAFILFLVPRHITLRGDLVL